MVTSLTRYHPPGNSFRRQHECPVPGTVSLDYTEQAGNHVSFVASLPSPPRWPCFPVSGVHISASWTPGLVMTLALCPGMQAEVAGAQGAISGPKRSPVVPSPLTVLPATLRSNSSGGHCSFLLVSGRRGETRGADVNPPTAQSRR